MSAAYISWIGEADDELATADAGGKGRGLDMLVRAGVRVPEAFVITTGCYRDAMTDELREDIGRRVAEIGTDDVSTLDSATEAIRELIVSGTATHDGDHDVRAAYRELCARVGEEDVPVAVRSSSAAEDAADRSFAGEHDSYLWVVGEDEVSEQVRRCWASLFTSRAVSYRARNPEHPVHEDAMAVVVQRMVDARSAGVFMTLNPANGDRSKIVIEALWGLGEPLVSGLATPDRFTVDKVTREVLDRAIADKAERATRDPSTGRGLATVPVESERRSEPSLSVEEVTELVRLGRAVEKFAGCPQDAEFAIAGAGGPDQIFLVQARPETVWSARAIPRAGAGESQDAMSRVIATLTRTPPPA